MHKQHFASGTGADIKAYIAATTYRREFVKIGSLDVPAKPGDLTEIKKVVSSHTHQKKHQHHVRRCLLRESRRSDDANAKVANEKSRCKSTGESVVFQR